MVVRVLRNATAFVALLIFVGQLVLRFQGPAPDRVKILTAQSVFAETI
jgi:hypothetical protein